MDVTDNTNDKYYFHRLFHHAKATLNSESRSYPCKIIDISLKGCLLRFDTPWTEPLEDIYSLKFELPDDINIDMQLSVTHVIANDASFKCEHIDRDSISQLHRLVKLNLGDTDILERDLLALSGLEQ
ncbi:MAG: PilZ domain-containing protein [Methylococcales bacterium]|nr:PilZ domain-containing protein [Methylococcales bacterium]MCK5478969.1 PilZ domain-containing protein [Methylococcales bacterium]